ncbi:LRR receptor kinase SERK2-like isoform X2 [Oryza glaberrima]|nr:LRR receptor kinase SERK2-like isoform X2 [Oryza glaberrima]
MKLIAFGLLLLGYIQYFATSDSEVIALYEIRTMLNDSRGVLNGWNNNQVSPCYFPSISCNQDQKVISITLISSGLSGFLSPSIAKLLYLQQLLLDGNSITGGLPQELGSLSSLTTLKLGGNSLSGSIPDSLGLLSKLQILNFSGNFLTGNIPASLSNISSLNDIDLSYNFLRGEIPKQLLQVSHYNYAGNHLNCGQNLTSCEGGQKNTGSNNKRHLLNIAIFSPIVAFCILFCWALIRRHRKGKQRLRESLKVRNEELFWGIEGANSDFKFFEVSQVVKATSNFSGQNKLGQGGFGPVYKGQFPDGMEIAVKRLASHSGQGLAEFKNEVQFIAKLQHRNLVRLLGCCSQGEEKMLVYEYLPNKSLDFFIFDETRRASLNWIKRLAVIEGIAEGLLYLHKHSRLRIIHRDVKASNILLDSEMNPKISDFGLAKMFSSNDAEGNTRRVVGTYGYMAPEYASEGLFSTKSDVFSFGVLILEIITGKRNSGFHQYEDFFNLLGYAWQSWKEGRWLQLVDSSLVTDNCALGTMRCINIALLCVQENAADRPSMSDVVAMLSSESMTLAEPKHPAYFHTRMTKEEVSTIIESCSVNDVTISTPQGR